MAADVFEFVGRTLDNRYRVDSVIGEGGFGVVYRGWHLTFEEPVAIKFLKIPAHFTAEARQTFEQRFRDEGRLLRKLGEQHKAVVRAYDVSILPGQNLPFLVLEWLDGVTLDETLKKRLASGQGPLGEGEAVALLMPAIEALALAHGGGAGQAIAHRDIKPENLFVLPGGTIKVLDFGIAKAMQEGENVTQQQSRTSSGFSAFSPLYGAPEQFSSKKYGESGPWTDIHALGLVLTEMVTGRRPYSEGEFADLLLEAISPERPTPRKLGARVSDGFEAICARALSLSPRDRFQNASEMLQALRAPSTRLFPEPAPPSPPPPSRPVSPATSLPEVVPLELPQPPQPEAPARGARGRGDDQAVAVEGFPTARRRLWPAAGAFALVAALGLFAGFRAQRPGAETKSSAEDRDDAAFEAAKKASQRGDHAEALNLLATLSPDSAFRQAPEFQAIYNAWADWTFQKSEVEIVPARKRALLKTIMQNVNVGAARRKRAAEVLSQIQSAGTGFKATGPAHVKVALDGKGLGNLPQEVKDSEPGPHKLTFYSSDRYQADERDVTFLDDVIEEIGPIKLKVLKGKATFTLETPGARVTLVSGTERRSIPQFPISIDFDTRKQWVLAASKDGFQDLKIPIRFDDGEAEKTFAIALSKASPEQLAGFR